MSQYKPDRFPLRQNKALCLKNEAYHNINLPFPPPLSKINYTPNRMDFLTSFTIRARLEKFFSQFPFITFMINKKLR
ncbi:predicted protein [Listeria monocytogenes FSL J2-071]|nr:predicted protein [Listeria monocytogenes FSL J2-071]